MTLHRGSFYVRYCSTNSHSSFKANRDTLLFDNLGMKLRWTIFLQEVTFCCLKWFASVFMTQRFIWVKSPEAISIPSPPLLPEGGGDSWTLQPIFWSSSSDFNWLTQIPYINMESVWRTIITAYLAYKSY